MTTQIVLSPTVAATKDLVGKHFAYEAGWHVPIAEKWDGLCERLQLDKNEFVAIVESHRDLLKRAYMANRKRDWATAQPIWAELAGREQVERARQRYEWWVEFCRLSLEYREKHGELVFQ